MKIVAISGASGSGKTSVVKHLAEQLASPYLMFDDYTDESTYPYDMKKWLKSGADLSQISTPRLIEALRALKSNTSSDYIFVEEPFGRCRPQIAELIDVVVLLDIPLELCLSRIIMRHINNSTTHSYESIFNYLSKYDDYLREVYKNATDQTRKQSDLLITDVISTASTAELIIQQLSDHYSLSIA